MDSSNESLDKKNKDLTNKSEVLAKTQAALTEASAFEATSGGTKCNIGPMSGALDSLKTGLSVQKALQPELPGHHLLLDPCCIPQGPAFGL